MSEKETEKQIEKFIKAVKNQYAALLIGDWRTANKNTAVITGVVKVLRSLDKSGGEILLGLTDHDDLAIASMAAAYSLNYSPEKSLSVLTRIAKEPGLIGFEAEQTIKRWEEGEWNL